MVNSPTGPCPLCTQRLQPLVTKIHHFLSSLCRPHFLSFTVSFCPSHCSHNAVYQTAAPVNHSADGQQSCWQLMDMFQGGESRIQPSSSLTHLLQQMQKNTITQNNYISYILPFSIRNSYGPGCSPYPESGL